MRLIEPVRGAIELANRNQIRTGGANIYSKHAHFVYCLQFTVDSAFHTGSAIEFWDRLLLDSQPTS